MYVGYDIHWDTGFTLTLVYIQGRSHQIWSDQVSGAYVSTPQQLGPHPPRKFWEFRGYEVASETISGPKPCFSESIQHWFWLSDRSLISQTTPFADGCWKARSFALFTAISYYVATCHHAVCVPRAFTEHWPYLATPSMAWVREKAVRLKPD